MARRTRHHGWAARLGAAALIASSCLVGTVALAGAAAAEDPPNGSDGSCDTRPVWHPDGGAAVPDGADCMLVYAAGSGALRAELWTWRDATSATWYNFPVDGVAFDPSTALAVCASFDAGAVSQLSGCSPDSGYLMFTTGSPYAIAPLTQSGDLYFCETLTFTSPARETAEACGVAESVGGSETAPPTAPAPTSPTGPTPTQPPDSPPSSPPVTEEPGLPPLGPPAPSLTGPVTSPTSGLSVALGDPPAATAPPAATTEPQPPTVGPSTAAVGRAPGHPTPPPSLGQSGSDKPDKAVSVARVVDSRFPTGLVIAFALLLAAGGVGILVVPALRDLRRTR